MTTDERGFHEALNALAEMCGVKLNAFMIGVFDETLAPFGYKNATMALNKYLADTKVWKFPTPAMVKEILQPNDEMATAQRIVGKIIKSVGRYGYSRPTDAKNEIGPIGWTVVEQFGGWSYICENLGHRMDVGTARAQMRDLVLAMIKGGDHPAFIALEEPKKNEQLESAVKLITKRID